MDDIFQPWAFIFLYNILPVITLLLLIIIKFFYHPSQLRQALLLDPLHFLGRMRWMKFISCTAAVVLGCFRRL